MSSVVISGNTSGTITLDAPAVAGTTTLTLPATSGTVIVNSGAQTIEFADGSAGAPSITNSGDTNTGMFFPDADTIAFTEGGAESMRIDSSGNVTVGTTATTYNYQTKNIVLYDGSSSGISVASGTKILTLTSQASAGCFVGTRSNDELKFVTNDTERMRIDSSGNLLLGTTSTASFTQTGTLYIGDRGTVDPIQIYRNSTGASGQIGFNNPNGRVGEIYTSGSSTVYATSSDYRLKENIIPITGALDVVSALKPVSYKWKVDGSDGQGFIAHELQAIVPDCVSGDKDAVDAEGKPVYQGVDTSFLVATLTAAIQELKAELDNVKTELATLKGTTL
jgi:hypothetical protein